MPFALGHRGARIYYDVVGDNGPYVVLIQGLGLSSRFWFDLPTRLSKAEVPYRAIVLDNRGVGRSDKPRGPYRMAHMADDVAAVLDTAGVKRAYVAGISLGGMIAQEFALRHPSRVDGLVLLATTPGLPHAHLPRPKALATLASLPFRGKRGGSALARLLLTEELMPRARELMSNWPDALRDDPTPPASFFAQLAAAALHSTGFRLGKLRCPTVVLTGDDDILIPPKNSNVLAARIPGAELEIIERCGHGVPIIDEVVLERCLARVAKLRHATNLHTTAA